MSATGPDHYSTLGVPRTASAVEIRAAYFRLVRVHTPEDAPERFQAISEAYRVLSDPVARKAYDAEVRLPPEVVAVLERAAALAEESPVLAREALRGILPRTKDLPDARFAAATILLRAGLPDDAEKLLAPLVQRFPDRSDFRVRLADAHLHLGRPDAAEQVLRRTLALDPKQREAYLMLAFIHERRGRPDDARRVLSRGRGASTAGGIDGLSFDIATLRLLVRARRPGDVEPLGAAIRGAVPADDEDARRHVAFALASAGEEHARTKEYDVAAVFFRLAADVDPHPALVERASELEGPGRTAAACRAAHASEGLDEWIRELLPAWFGAPHPQAQWEALCRRIQAMAEADVHSMDRTWASFAARHPVAAAAIVEAWTALRGGPVPDVVPDAPRTPVVLRNRKTGPAAIVLTTLLLVGLAVFALVQRDRRLREERNPLGNAMSWQIEQAKRQFESLPARRREELVEEALRASEESRRRVFGPARGTRTPEGGSK